MLGDHRKLESIDHLVTDKQEVLDAIYNRFNGPDAVEVDPLTKAMEAQTKREKQKYDAKNKHSSMVLR